MAATDARRDMERDAFLSLCGTYRYWLSRRWDPARPTAGFLMLNPSTADHEVDDPTIRKCVQFARSWGCGGIEVYNLFAFRATSPKDLGQAADPVGPISDLDVYRSLRACKPIVAAWGSSVPKAYGFRPADVMKCLTGLPVSCLKVNADGSPKHPLYVRGDTQPVPYTASLRRA